MKEEKRFTTTSGTDVVIKPISSNALVKSQFVYNSSFKEALENGCLLKNKLFDYMKEQGLWDEKKDDEYKDLLTELSGLDRQLNSGKDADGKKLSVTQGQSIAMELHEKRSDLIKLTREKSSLDASTAESVADQAKFNFLLTKCVYDYKTQKPIYSNVDEYLEVGDNIDSLEIAQKFAEIFYGVDPDHEKTLTEFKFLKRFGFIDDEGNFINKEGQKVDINGDLIQEDNEDSEKYDVTTADFEDDTIKEKPKPKRKSKTSTKE